MKTHDHYKKHIFNNHSGVIIDAVFELCDDR
jgi:hypothetical protein